MSRNRKKRLALIITVAIFYIVITTNYHKIKFAISMFRLYNHEKKVTSAVNNKNASAPVSNPLLDILISTKNDTDQVEKEEINPINQDKNPETDSADSLNANNANEKISYIEILTKYNDVLEKLSLSFESQLDALIQDGIKEYTNGSLSSKQLAKKYISIGSDLEKASDDEFSGIIKQLENELKSKGYDISITKDIKKYYTASKDLKKTELIDRGIKHVETHGD